MLTGMKDPLFVDKGILMSVGFDLRAVYILHIRIDTHQIISNVMTELEEELIDRPILKLIEDTFESLVARRTVIRKKKKTNVGPAVRYHEEKHSFWKP